MTSFLVSAILEFIEKYYHKKRVNKYIKKYNYNIIFDIGANRGQFIESIIKSNINYNTIYSFEPQKDIYNKLKHTCNCDGIKRICINKAISNLNSNKNLKINKIKSTSTFSKINNNSIWYKIKNLLITGSKKSSFIVSENVQTVTLDTFIENNSINSVDLLKIDTEGHEFEVLKGAINNIRNKKIKIILLEVQLSNMFLDYDYNEIHNFLKTNSYVLKKKFKFPLFMFEDRVYILEN